jgi:biotin/methionine sulfoxide reductase
MKPVSTPPGEARDDYEIFTELARRLGAEDIFTEGLNQREWLVRLYEESVPRAAAAGIELPSFEAFWQAGSMRLPAPDRQVVMFDAFRRDPQAAPLGTPSGRIELFSERIAGFELADCPGHPAWFAPVEWLGADGTARHPLHLVSDQPFTKLHSQLDFSSYSRDSKIADREPIWINPADAAARGIDHGDVVRVFNERGACLAGAVLTDAMMPNVVKLSTGAWWDPVEPGVPGSLDKHGNPNVLTRDAPSSSLSQGCSAQSCLVQIERFEGPLPAITAFDPPRFTAAKD